MSEKNAKVAFVGGGNMAYALATRLAASAPYDVVVAEPLAAARARFRAPVATTEDNLAAVRNAAAVVLAVKPQVVRPVVEQIAGALHPETVVVSIAAGVPLVAVERWLGGSGSVVRCMPNTPALVGLGITGLVASAGAGKAQRALAETILAATGDVVWFASDAELDAVTALSGSGPAYFFHLIEALADAGQQLGLPAEVAKRLVTATAVGAAAMAAEDDPAALRERVTSPGGTTARALSILAARAFPETVAAAVRGAYDRSRELAEELGSDG